jgi:hypothetical protein
MNKKLATLLFAIGLGTAAAPAFASCAYWCEADYNTCLQRGFDPAQCEAQLDACYDAC